jgi:DNA-binding NarL/FixJ family response regulator
MTESISILIVDDEALVRTGLQMICDSSPELMVIGEAVDGADAVEKAEQLRPDVVLMDIRMPVMDGVEATRRIMAASSSARVIVLTTYDLDEYAYSALKAGASGFLLKDLHGHELIEAIKVVGKGDALLAPSLTRRLLDRYASTFSDALHTNPDLLCNLTHRELEVLKLVARGLTNHEIAMELVVTEATVKTHISAILRKLNLRDRVQAVVFAFEIGLVRPQATT